jgi:tetratricopeptide (TPR) repeat protein
MNNAIVVFSRRDPASYYRIVRFSHPKVPVPYSSLAEFILADYLASLPPDAKESARDIAPSDCRLFAFQSALVPVDPREPCAPGADLVFACGDEGDAPDAPEPPAGAAAAAASALTAALEKQGHSARALALARLNSASDLGRYVRLLFKYRQWPDLQGVVPRIRAEHPRDAHLAMCAAVCLRHVGEAAQAQAEFARALALDPEDSAILANFALFQLTCLPFDAGEVRALLARAVDVQLAADPLVTRVLVRYWAACGDPANAVRYACRNRTVLKHFAQLMARDPVLVAQFITVFKTSRFDPKDIADIAHTLYLGGCVEVALRICGDHWAHLFVARVYFIILLNEGLYRRFGECALEFTRLALRTADAQILKLTDFLYNFQASCLVAPARELTPPTPTLDLASGRVSDRHIALTDVVSTFPVFLFCLGSLKGIDRRFFSVDTHLPFWRLRRVCENIATLFRPPALDPGCDLRMFFSVGDDCAVFPCTRKWGRCRIIPRPIYDLSLWSMRRKHSSGPKHSFWTQLGRLDPSETAGVILLLGNADCEWEIPRLVKKLRFAGVSLAIDFFVGIYKHVLTKVAQMFPGRVWVHPAVSREICAAPIVWEFNRKLCAMCAASSIPALAVLQTSPLELLIDGSEAGRYRAVLETALWR